MRLMKSTIFFPPVVSLLLVAASAGQAAACGPFPPVIPTPEFFGLSVITKTMPEYEREENLKLWQSLTSGRIPLADIEEAVYHDSCEQFYDRTGYYGDPNKTENLFYVYLNNTGDSEIVDFLGIAKEMEERRRDILSPWYYPQDRGSGGETGDFSDLIKRCEAYDGVRLKDRYALQITRALFASRRYADCIEYCDSAFADIPDANLMKRMAQRYVAGCWSRLGETRRADSLFAKAGDMWSITRSDPVELMARMNPDAPQLMEYVRSKASDTVFMRKMLPVAEDVLKRRRVRNKGDWRFLLAYVHGEFNRNVPLARKEIYRAMRQPFSSGELEDLARAYKMKLDGQAGDSRNLLSDLKWMESKIDALNPDAREWIRRCGNIIYVDWIPRLWKKRDYSTAILLCSYAENLAPAEQRYTVWDIGVTEYWWKPSRTASIHEIRDSENSYNLEDYGCLSFQMMGSLSSSQLAAAYGRILSGKPLYNFLRRKAYTDKNYFNELIGTLALREENYARAADYLSRVGERYLKTMNVDKDGYLSRDPFVPYPSRWVSGAYYDGEIYEYESSTVYHRPVPCPSAKLDFARKMQAYKRTMSRGRSADERGLARLMYAIGRRNSFEECWALTQYWRGGCVNRFYPALQYWEEKLSEYGFLYDYETTIGHKTTEGIYEKEVAAALAMLATDEAQAKANYILGNLRTVVKRYGNTTTARYVKSSCDNWKSWL